MSKPEHGLANGDVFTIPGVFAVPKMTRWQRLLAFILRRRPPPPRQTVFRVVKVTESSFALTDEGGE